MFLEDRSDTPARRDRPALETAFAGRLAMAGLLAAALLLTASTAEAHRRNRGICTHTARLQQGACVNELADDSLTQLAICANESDSEDVRACQQETRQDAREGRKLCRQQFRARQEVCVAIGEGPYDPDFSPDAFDPNFENPANPNLYFPLTIGDRWEYESEDETNVVEVLDATKLIEGVTCIVVHDVVTAEGASEDTNDWYGLRRNGDVNYCGEESKDFEIFEGDMPPVPELVEIEGSFKVGRDGAKSGTLFLGTPIVGQSYRQEWSPGDAEDWATVVSTTYRYGDDEDLDELVPEELANLLCDGDCVVTKEGTPLEPDANERKFYAPGIGVFLEVDLAEEAINQLVGCNFASVCESLPEF